MKWSERLKTLKTHERQSCPLTSPTHSESVSNVSEQDSHIRKNQAPAEMPSGPELVAICRRAVADYPSVDADRLRRFLEVAEDPEWCSERVARHIARRMSEGLIND